MVKKTSISIVIPAYNEEKRINKTIQLILKYLKKRGFDYEIVVVDDGSKDKTIQTVSQIKENNLTILKNIPNRGKGYTVRRGMLEAKKDLILFTDADNSTPIEELDNFLKYINNYDIIIASRNMKESDIKIKQPLIRSTLGKIFPLLVKLIAVKGIKDTQCGFKLFKKEAAKKIFEKQTMERFAFDVEILYIARKYKLNIKELPVVWINDEGSKVDPIKDSISMFLDLLKVKVNDWKGLY